MRPRYLALLIDLLIYMQTHSWINNNMKALQWAFKVYPRPADATVEDLRKLKAVQDVLKTAKNRDANQNKE
jgi:hypothetical protein